MLALAEVLQLKRFRRYARPGAGQHGSILVPVMRRDTSVLGEIAKLIDSGKLTPIVETVLPLSEARKAHELNEERHARGKIVLKVA